MPTGNTATPENKPIGAFENQPDATSQRDGKTDVNQRSDADLASEQTVKQGFVDLLARLLTGVSGIEALDETEDLDKLASDPALPNDDKSMEGNEPRKAVDTSEPTPVQVSTILSVEVLLDENAALKAEVSVLMARVSALIEQIQKQKRRRVTVDRGEDFDGRAAAGVAVKLMALKGGGHIPVFRAASRGPKTPHPDYWVVAHLQPLVDSGKLTKSDMLLALQDPGVWFSVDEGLYRVKVRRNDRESHSQPLADLQIATKQSALGFIERTSVRRRNPRTQKQKTGEPIHA